MNKQNLYLYILSTPNIRIHAEQPQGLDEGCWMDKQNQTVLGGRATSILSYPPPPWTRA